MKRVLSFVLVLVMMLSALPFAAFADDGVEPCAEAVRCSACGSYNTTISYPVHTTTLASSPCDNTQNPMVHHHTTKKYCKAVTCHSCGEYAETELRKTVYCETRGKYI